MSHFIFLLFPILQLFNTPATDQLATLSVQVTNISSIKGGIRIGVYDSASSFPKDGKQLKGLVVKVESKTQTLKLVLPTGKKYGIAVYHDANGNGKMDKNTFGVPTENYGFSNDARGTFSAPSFEEAAVYLDGDKTIQIRLD